MTTPSGQIGLSDVNVELGFPSTTSINMNQSNVRTLAGVGGSGTVISMNDLRGKSNRVALSLTISSSTYNYNAYSAVSASPTYSAGKTDATITINPGITVGSTSTGSAAFSIPSSFNPGDTVTVVNNGTIVGCAGNGGNGGSSPGTSDQPGFPGGSGGTALLVQRTAIITNNGTVGGGGGGGGGGGSIANLITSPSPEGPSSEWQSGAGGGGGGGAGYNSGSGGSRGPIPTPSAQATNGSPGTQTSGGGGGPGGRQPSWRAQGGAGGTGGGRGSAGSNGQKAELLPGSGNPGPGPGQPGGSGGGAGAYISGAPYVTWPATGTRLGPSS